MREILFRGFTPVENGKSKVFVNGKCIEGQWVEGSYWKLNKTTYCIKEDYESDPDNTEHYIVFDQMTDWGLPNRHLQADVIPETVGQYTGLTDKNGKRIFEGDIVGVYDDYLKKYCLGIVKYGEFNCSCCDGVYGWFFEGGDIREYSSYEVLGNIHDNPELLEGATSGA